MPNMKPITFCIASANNEREYTHLLLRSLQQNTDISKHEILIFIDSDNQNTYESLMEKKSELPNMRIYRNTSGFPIGSQRNVSLMFGAANNDIVCYLQSDMVVSKDFDKHISDNMDDEKTVLSCARIEPPLHPPGPEKIVKDFGITPEEFKWNDFNQFVAELQSENRPNMIGHFAPFAIYKRIYFDVMGGFDTQFRCSREDSDFIIRLEQNGLTAIQSWNACVYHFTCVSSRGKDWYKQDEDAKYKNVLQQNADSEELKRFIRKWGFFGHHPKPVYNIGLFIDMDKFVDTQLLEYVEPYFTNIYINDKLVTRQLKETAQFKSHYYANLRWKYSHEHWESKSHLFTPVDFENRIQYLIDQSEITNDAVMSIKFSDMVKAFTIEDSVDVRTVIENSHSVIDSYDIGEYELNGLRINIRQKNDISDGYKRANIIDTIINDDVFEFL